MSPSPKPIAPNPRPIDPHVSIGHVHLKVADLNRAVAFYCDVLGFDLMRRHGHEAAFLSAGGYHHHIALNTWESKGALPPAPHTTGLYHLAIRYPTRAALADALRTMLALASKAQVITVLARHSICAILTRMASSYLGIDPKPNGL
jgi:catechol 2,3-dioxygenase